LVERTGCGERGNRLVEGRGCSDKRGLPRLNQALRREKKVDRAKFTAFRCREPGWKFKKGGLYAMGSVHNGWRSDRKGMKKQH